MPKNQKSLNTELFNFLMSAGYDPTALDTSASAVPVPEEAEVFQFNFVKDGEDYGKVTISIDGMRKLIVYYGSDVADSPKADTGDGMSWYSLIKRLKKFAYEHQLSFELKDMSRLKHDMAKREYTKKLDEGYHSMGKKASYSDSVPTTKMIIKHKRNMEEGEQRYRQIDKIFIENINGERFMLETTKPGLARVYARHVAEGGKQNDERWNHINSLCEEYGKMAGFVRATRSNQFNESAQQLVAEGINHYQKLRECLGKMAGKKGYNNYFESYTPSLMENEESVDLSEMFMSSSLDPRIECVMPILGKLSKNIAETSDLSEVKALEEWADSVIEATDPISIPEEKVEESYPKHQDLGGVPTDKLKAYLAKHGTRPGPGEGNQVKRVRAELQTREQGVAESVDYKGDAETLKKQGNMTGYHKTMVRHYDALADNAGHRADAKRYEALANKHHAASKGVAEDLDANQKRVGQLGPTEKVGPKGAHGKLVGAMESADPLSSILRLIK